MNTSQQQELMLLLKKFKENKLSQSEMAKLSTFLNEIGETQLDDELSKIWNLPEYDFNEITGNSFIEIKQLLRERGSLTHENKKDKLKIFLIQTLKYAAIVAITFGISWFLAIKSLNNKKEPAVTFHEFIVPFGSKSRLILADSTEVWLNSGSRIKYSSEFSSENRNVYFEGEAFFNVKHNPRVPFVVKTDNVLVKVYGTKFNLKSFPEEQIVETALLSGSISLTKVNKEGKASDQLYITPNQIAKYSKETGDFQISDALEASKNKVTNQASSIQDNPKINQSIELLTAWKDDRLVFRKVNLEQLTRKLERWYGVEIVLKNETLKQYSYTGTFEKETIEQALNALKVAYPFKYTINKNVITIEP